MSFGMNAEYSRFHKSLMDLAQQMPEKFDLRTKSDENSRQKLEKSNQMINEFLATQGLKLYLHTKPHKMEGIKEITGPSQNRVDLIVKELDIVKLLRKPEKMERLILVNEADKSLKFLKSGESGVSESTEINLKLKPSTPEAAQGQTVGQNLHAKALDENDIRILNQAMTMVIEEIHGC